MPEAAPGQTYGIANNTLLMQPFTVVMDRAETRNNTAVLADARDLIYSIGANETITWKMTLFFGGVGDVKIGIFTPAGTFSGGFIITWVPPGGVAAVAAGVFAAYNINFAQVENSAAAGDEYMAILEGRLVNGPNSGFFRLQWAQVAAALVNSNLLAGSRMEVWKFSP